MDITILCNGLLVGATTAKRGRKPKSAVHTEKQTNGTAPLPVSPTPTETLVRKTKVSFKGKLSHTSPVLDAQNSQEKITVYFPAIKTEELSDEAKEVDIISEGAKSLVLQRVFAKVKGKFRFLFV